VGVRCEALSEAVAAGVLTAKSLEDGPLYDGAVSEASKPPVRRDRRLRRGSVSPLAHGIAEYCVGALTIAAPFFFSFDSDTAKVFSILVGAAIIVHAFSTDSPAGVARNIPIASHVVLDYVGSLLMIVSPFIFGFTDDTAATAYFIVVGLGFLLLTIATKYHEA
jgi:hypothetical protein